MNARQAAKAAAKRIEDLEDFNRRASNDIKALYTCIDSVIAGEKSFCEWCEEFDECNEPEKVSGPIRGGAGCENFWLKQNHGITGQQIMTLSGQPEAVIMGKDGAGEIVSEGGE